MELTKMPAYMLREMLGAKKISVREVLDAYYAKIRQVDQRLGAYLTLCEERAYAQVDAAQKSYDTGVPSPLAGIPIAVKDNIYTEGVRTTCASKMLESFVPPYSATVIERLDGMGAIMLGKTNLDEFAMGCSTEHSYFQKTLNPWDARRVPGGSSGGSAAAVAAGLAPLALGSDTGGSVRQPAAFCGVYGLKPTYGSVSRHGLVAFAPSFDQIGPLANNVTDTALLFAAICGHDPKDSTSSPKSPPDFMAALNGASVKGLTFGLPKEYFGEWLAQDSARTVDAAISHLRRLGANFVEISLPLTKYSLPIYYVLSRAEASSNLARFDGVKYGRRAQCEQLSELYVKSRSEGFGPEVQRRILLGTYVLSCGNYDTYYKKALRARTLLRASLDDALKVCDLILTPTTPTSAFKFNENSGAPGNMYYSDIFTVSANIAGLPALSLPCGLSGGLPVGMQFIGPAFSESLILRAARAYEQAGGGIVKEL